MELFSLVGRIAINASEAMSEIDKVSQKASGLAEGFKSAGDKISGIGKKMTAGITTVGVAVGGWAIKTAASFEEGMSEVAAISGATGDDLKALTEKAKYMGETTKFSASDAADGLKYMAMAGWKTSDMLDGLEGIMNLAAASGEDLGLTSDIVTDALTAFGLSAKDSTHFADLLATASSNSNTNVAMMGETFKYVAPVAGALGFSAEDTALAIGLMANSGIKASQAGTSLRSILTNLGSEVVLSGKAFAGAGEETGEFAIATTNADGSMRSLNDIMMDLRSGFDRLTDSEKSANAESIAGKNAMSGLLAIVGATDADISKLSESISNCDGSAKNMADTMNDNLSGQITLLKSQLEGLAIQFVEFIMPYLMQGVEWLSKLFTWIANLDEGTKKMIITVGAILTAAGPILILVGKIVSSIGSIISVGGTLIGGFAKLSSGIGGIVSIGSKVIGGIGTLVAKIGTVLIPAITTIGAPVLIVIGVIAALIAIGVALYKNWDEVKAFASATWEAIKNGVSIAVEKIGAIFMAVIDFLTNNWQGILLLIVNPVAGAFKLLYDNCEGFREFIDKIFTGIIDFLTNNWQGVLLLIINPVLGAFKLLYDNCAGFREFIDGFIDGIKEGFSNAVTAISDKFHELKDKASEKIHELKENVTNYVEEMKEKAVQKVTELKDKATDKFHELKNAGIEKFTELRDKGVEKVTELRDKGVEKVTQLKDNAVEKLTEMKEKSVQKVAELKENAVSRLSDLKDKLGNHVYTAKDIVVSGFTELKEGAGQKLTEFKNVADEKIDSFKESAVNKFTSFKDAAANKITELKDSGVQKLAELAEKGVAGFETIKEKGTAAIENLKAAALQKFTDMGNNIRESFNNVANNIFSIFDKVKQSVINIVDNIKSLFTFEWKLPDIKLPHFSIDGSFSLSPPSIPKIEVEWYAEGGVMTKPTAFGFNPFTGKVMGGGEAGAEAIAPISVLQTYVSDAVSARNTELLQALNVIYALLQEYLPQLSQKQLVLDTGQVVGELADPLNRAIGAISRKEERIR